MLPHMVLNWRAGRPHPTEVILANPDLLLRHEELVDELQDFAYCFVLGRSFLLKTATSFGAPL